MNSSPDPVDRWNSHTLTSSWRDLQSRKGQWLSVPVSLQQQLIQLDDVTFTDLLTSSWEGKRKSEDTEWLSSNMPLAKACNNPKLWSIPLQTQFLSWQSNTYPSRLEVQDAFPTLLLYILKHSLWEDQQNEAWLWTYLGPNLGFVLHKLRTLKACNFISLGLFFLTGNKVAPLTSQV